MMKRLGKLLGVALGTATLGFVGVVLAQVPVAPSPSGRVEANLQQRQASAQAIQGLNVRVESVPTVELKSPSPGWSGKDITQLIVSGISGFIALVAVIYAKRGNDKTVAAAQKSTEATLWQKANETELKDIQAQLDEFYGPYLQMSEANHLMAQELRSRQPDIEEYRMLVKVFDRAWLDRLSAADRTIVRLVCEKAIELETFIRNHAKMVDRQILPYLSRASAHFRILYLAHKGELGSEFPAHLARYVYPRNLDEVLKLEVKRLENRCSLLRASPSAAPGRIEPLVIPGDLSLEEWPLARARDERPRRITAAQRRAMSPDPSQPG